MMETLHSAGGPAEAALCVTQVGHDVAILPATPLGARSSQVTGWWWAVVHGTQAVEGRQGKQGRGVDWIARKMRK